MKSSDISGNSDHGWQIRILRSKSGQIIAVTRPCEEHEQGFECETARALEEGSVIDYEQSRENLLFPKVGERHNLKMFHDGPDGKEEVSLLLSGIVTEIDPDGGSTIVLDSIVQQQNLLAARPDSPPSRVRT